jgi:hypothetical protein
MVVAAMTFDGAPMTLRIKEDFGPFELEAAVADVPAFSEEFAVSPNAPPILPVFSNAPRSRRMLRIAG